MTHPTGRADLDNLVIARHLPGEEPRVLLRGRDPAAAPAFRAWAWIARDLGVPIAVVEQALQQADALEAWPHKQLPGDDHLTQGEARQLAYQHSRRAWRARDSDNRASAQALALAERRGWDAAMAAVRLGQIDPILPRATGEGDREAVEGAGEGVLSPEAASWTPIGLKRPIEPAPPETAGFAIVAGEGA